MALIPITSGSGAQTVTQSPQSAGQSLPGGANSSQVQPGTASEVLAKPTGNIGVPLNDTPVTTVNLNATTTSTQAQQPPATTTPPAHHINPALLGISIALFVAAIVLFWLTSRSEKNTTN